ncbi:MAG: PQQ-binding-like beta-propeller repeat protein, partial [Chitinophagales bacterium]
MRKNLCLQLLLLCVFIMDSNAQQSAPAKNVMFRGNASLNGVYDSKPAYQLNGVLFTFKTNGPIRSTAATYDETVFFGSGDENFYAVDATTGNERWRFKTNGAINSSPAISDGVAFFTSRDGRLYALQARDGKKLWEYQFGKDLPYENGWDYYLSSPVIVDQMLYVGSGDGYLYAFDVKTKKNLWKFNAGARIRTAPAISNDVVVFGALDGAVYALRSDDGSQQWKFTIKGADLKFENFGYDVSGILCSPAIGDGIVAIGGRDGFLYAIDLQTGKQKWNFDHEGSWVLSTAINNGKVFAASGSSAFVQEVEIATGKEQWRFNSSSAIFSSMALAGEMLYFGDYNGNVYGLNSKTGVEQWHFPMGTRTFSSPSVANGIVYCSSDDGVLYALSGSQNISAGLPPVKKAVYWEGIKSDTIYHWFQNNFDVYIRDYFKA